MGSDLAFAEASSFLAPVLNGGENEETISSVEYFNNRLIRDWFQAKGIFRHRLSCAEQQSQAKR